MNYVDENLQVNLLGTSQMMLSVGCKGNFITERSTRIFFYCDSSFHLGHNHVENRRYN